jgi:hypothetical protein
MSIEREKDLKSSAKLFLEDAKRLVYVFGNVCDYLRANPFADESGLVGRIEFVSSETSLHTPYIIKEFANVLRTERKSILPDKVLSYIIENREEALKILSNRKGRIEELCKLLMTV